MAKNYKNYAAPAFVLLLAGVIRFYNYNNVPYTHDELSALSRLEFPGISELIENGIRPDGHPALIQLFLYLWTKIAGTSEVWVKLPFVFFGLFSVLLTYHIGKRWFGNSPGLFAAAFMSCTQFFIIYSQYARPYISGCLLSLIALHLLLKILFDPQTKKTTYIWFAVTLALCALDHHMCMLFAFLAALCGLLFVQKKILVPYLLSCTAAVIFYLPHLSITLDQLSIGGVGGWLNPPSSNFILKFIFFLFHYSYLTVAVIVVIIALSRISGRTENTSSPKLKIRILLALLFVLSWLIPYLYSLFVNPLLQYSTLIFASPCLLLFIFSFMAENKLFLRWSALALMCAVLLFSLAYNRRFFEFNYRQGFEQFVLTVNHFQKKYPEKKIVSIVKAEEWFIDYYLKKYNLKASFICQPNDYSFTSEDIKRKLDSAHAEIVLVGNLEPNQVYQAKNYCPQLVKYDYGYTYETLVFCKECNEAEVEGPRILKSQELNFETNGSFNLDKNKVVVDTIEGAVKTALAIRSEDEYPLATTIKISEWNPVAGNHFLSELLISSGDSLSGLLCTTVQNVKDSILYFSASELKGFRNDGKKNFKVFHSAFVGTSMEKSAGETLKTFVWNKDKSNFKVYTFKLSLVDFNPYRYALLEKINE